MSLSIYIYISQPCSKKLLSAKQQNYLISYVCDFYLLLSVNTKGQHVASC